MRFYNKYGKEDLLKKLEAEDFERITLSFYRYVVVHNLEIFRNNLYTELDALGVLGRVYLAHEGVNAQVSIPEHRFDAFRELLEQNAKLRSMRLNVAVEQGRSFLKLIVRIRKKIVADGLFDDTFDVSNVGKHLSASEFNAALADPEAVVIDMRNHYESEVGYFEKAVRPDASTFRELLPNALELARGKEKKKILLYCTGGIRCEKASAYFRHHGFEDVNQLYGGIISYAHEVKNKRLPSRYIGKNFVFDERLGERITADIISRCHQCNAPADTHTNCANKSCHLLFIQCHACNNAMNGCCTTACKDALALPPGATAPPVSGDVTGPGRKNIYHPQRHGKLTLGDPSSGSAQRT